MAETRRYEIDGMIVEIPLHYDEMVERDLEDYPDFAADPVYTPEGRPLTVCIDDACKFAEAIEPPRLVDCSDCRFFRRAAEGTLFGVCECEYKRKKISYGEAE